MENKLIIRTLSTGGDGPSVLKLSGPVVLQSLFSFQDALRGETADTLILDLTEVPYVDSAAIGSMVNAHVSRVNSGRRMALVGVSDRVATILSVTGVLKVFSTFPTLEAAQESMRQAATS